MRLDWCEHLEHWCCIRTNRQKIGVPARDDIRHIPMGDERLIPMGDERLIPMRDERLIPMRDERLIPMRDERLIPVWEWDVPMGDRRQGLGRSVNREI